MPAIQSALPAPTRFRSPVSRVAPVRVDVTASADDVVVRITWRDGRGQSLGGQARQYAHLSEIVSFAGRIGKDACRIIGTGIDAAGEVTQTTLFVGTEREVHMLAAALASDRVLARTLWQLAVFSDPDARDPAAFEDLSDRVITQIEEELTLDLAQRISAILAG